MVGTYFDSDPEPEHVCSLPVEHFGEKRGWRCECGLAFVKESLPARDVNPGERPWQWIRSPEHDETYRRLGRTIER